MSIESPHTLTSSTGKAITGAEMLAGYETTTKKYIVFFLFFLVLPLIFVFVFFVKKKKHILYGFHFHVCMEACNSWHSITL